MNDDSIIGVRARNSAYITKTYPKPDDSIITRYLPDYQGELGFSVSMTAGVATLYRWETDHWEKCTVDQDWYAIVFF